MNHPMPQNVTIAGHRTTMRLEPEFWDALNEVAEFRGMHRDELVGAINECKPVYMGLTSAVRVSLLEFYKSKATEEL